MAVVSLGRTKGPLRDRALIVPAQLNHETPTGDHLDPALMSSESSRSVEGRVVLDQLSQLIHIAPDYMRPLLEQLQLHLRRL